MVKGADVLSYLIPTGGWVIYENDFNTIIYDEGVEPITKKQFDDAFKIVNDLLTNELQTKTNAKAALLDKLGITAEEAALLLS